MATEDDPFIDGRQGTRENGASFFSVPSSAVPSSGVYTMPVEAFRFKNLDSGESFTMDERYWIKDVDTGNVYVVEPVVEPEKPSKSSHDEGLRVSDLLSGEAMSLMEFEKELGYLVPPPTHETVAVAGTETETETGADPPLAKNPLKWIRKRLSFPSLSTNALSPLTQTVAGGLKVKASASKRLYEKEFASVSLMKVISEHQGVVWTMKFSRSGTYLASAGQDCSILLWEVRVGTSTEFLSETPYRKYVGHKQDVLDVAWSKTNLLLSASMDKTVRLWHPSMLECLRVFKHQDFVTAIDFHPTDERMFVSGSIDGKVRLWNIPDQVVLSWQGVHDMITAVTFSPESSLVQRGVLHVVVGTMRGQCTFFNVVPDSGEAGNKYELQYEAQLDVKNKKKSRGKKITGLVHSPVASTCTHLLVTSNDSRIRLYDGYVMKSKYKGHANASTQIRASFSPCGKYVICGSDDGRVYIWNTFLHKSTLSGNSSSPERRKDNESDDESEDDGDNDEGQKGPKKRVKNSAYESFGLGTEIITVALFGPENSPESKLPEIILAAGHSGEIFVYKVDDKVRSIGK